MNAGKVLGMTVVGAMLGLGVAGCTASADTGADVDDDETVESTSDELSAGSCAPSGAAGVVPKKHRALLDTIAYAEGTRGRGQDGYNVTFAYRYFSSCAKHPNMKVCSGRYCSTAAGRYQFLTGTWKGLGYSSFSPANQDRGGMKLISRRGANIPTGRALTATEFANTMNRISYEWASLPPGRYGQPSYSMAATRKKYCSFAGC
ncbi:MAG: glycoside hydrolase family 104 protein [Labilithrix sp.]|nr:glycoside hydrolase family 104 protein [Labilithrix sp.]MBX3223012.1 glycoside hydrolase family 104 protein [Labilithrix sp.]